MEQIPKPPKTRVITDEDRKRFGQWVRYFRNLSSRTRIVTPTDVNFENNILFAKEKATDFISNQKILCRIADWPVTKDIAFIVAINSAKPGRRIPDYKVTDAYIFCFNNLSFGIAYHKEDEVDEAVRVKSYSLQTYSKEELEWEHTSRIILDKVEEYSNLVPERPS